MNVRVPGYYLQLISFFSLLPISVTTGLVIRTFWTWYGRFTDPPPPVGKGGSSWRRVRS